MEKWLKEIEKEVRLCGERMLTADRAKTEIDVKGAANFVTNYDLLNQEHLKRRLPEILPGAVFVGEEEALHASVSNGYAFIVDPIDGTTNFIKDCRASAVSVGITKDGSPFAGVIYNPYLDEMYVAEVGCGAFCNGEQIHVSSRSLSDGITAFGTSPYNRELSRETFRIAYDYFMSCVDVHRCGSAAIELCSVAAGRTELYFELLLQPWDYAAGVVIVGEAGGEVLTMDKTAVSFDKPCSVLAASRGILAALPDPRHPGAHSF